MSVTQQSQSPLQATVPTHARLWIYIAPRTLSAEESATLNENAKHFFGEWHAHGQPLMAWSTLWQNRVWIIAADEQKAAASGCSIDRMVRWVNQVGDALGVSFLDRMWLILASPDGPQFLHLDMQKPISVPANAHFFDHTATHAEQLSKRWPAPVAGSWCERFVAFS